METKTHKKKPWILMLFIGLMFLMTGCSTKYDDGKLCGKAEVGGASTYSEMRAYYVMQYQLAQAGLNIDTKYVYDEQKQEVRIADKEEIGTFLPFFLIESQTDEENNKFYLDAGNHKVDYFINYADHLNEVETYLTLNVDKTLESNVVDNKIPTAAELIASYQGVITKYQTHLADKSLDSASQGTNVKTLLTSHTRACMVFEKDGFTDPATGVTIGKTTWKAAFDYGFLTGLFVYPMAWFINLFIELFGSTGVAKVAAMFIATIFVKLIVMLFTFKSTMSTQKMQDIQPEILKIQAKYGQSPTGEARQRMSMEMMAIYKKYNVKPFAPFISLLVTFPVFIAMFRAVDFSASLRTGSFLGVVLGDTISTSLFSSVWPGALVIFTFMAITQIVSMKLPQIMNKKRMTLEAKKSQKQMTMMSNIFMIMILVMGFMMPAMMSIYWIASATVSIIQSIITHKINDASKGKGRYKVKKVEKTYTIPKGTSIEG